MRQFELFFLKCRSHPTRIAFRVPKNEGMRYFQAHPIRNGGEDFFLFHLDSLFGVPLLGDAVRLNCRYLVNVVIVLED